MTFLLLPALFFRIEKTWDSTISLRRGVLQNKDTRETVLYSATSTAEGDNLSLFGRVVLDGHTVLSEIHDSWIRGEDYFPVLKGELLKSYYEKIKSSFVVPEEQADYEQYGYFIAFSAGMFYGWLDKPIDDAARNILKRFASVIDLTFKRYFDLQNAEINLREAQIEASLERVRTRTMAMHNSEDVGSAIATMFTELEKLGVENSRCGIANIHTDQSMEVWSVTTDADGKILKEAGALDVKAHPLWRILFEEWEKKEEFRHYYLAGNEKGGLYQFIKCLAQLSDPSHPAISRYAFSGIFFRRRRCLDIFYAAAFR